MFKNKKNKNRSLDPKIHLSQKNKEIPLRKKKRFILFKKKNKENRSYKRKKRLEFKKYLRIILLLAFILFLGFLIYRSIFWIIELRSSNSEGINTITYVVGFDDLPTYPNSEYIFPDESDDTVSQFLTTGRAIYRLARNNTIDDVFEYYSENLSVTEWDHILSVPRTSHEMMYGEYYFNEKLGYGVRIYDRVNDVWYEKVTKDEALNGKAAQVSKKYERDLILSSDQGTKLLPDFPWSLSVPKEYLIKYFATNEGDLRGVTFTEITTGNETVLEPIAELDGSADDIYAEIYVSKLNERTKSEADEMADNNLTNLNNDNSSLEWDLVNTQYVDINGVYLLEATFNHKTELTKMYVLHNERVKYAYAIHLLDNDESFLSFMLLNMQEQKSDYTGDEFKLDE